MTILLDEKAIQEVTVKVPNGDSFSECFQNCYKVVAHAQARAIAIELTARYDACKRDGGIGDDIASMVDSFIYQLESELKEGK